MNKKVKYNFVVIALVLVLSFLCGLVGYLLRKYQNEEQKIVAKIEQVKKTNAQYPIDNDKKLNLIITKQQKQIDSLIKHPYITKEYVSSGFSINGQSITSNDLIKYTNDLYKEKQYYKNLYEILQKKYNVSIKDSANNISMSFNDPERKALIEDYNNLVKKDNALVQEYNKLNKEKSDYKQKSKELEIALKLIKKNYNIDFKVEKENDSTNVISVDKIKKSKAK